MKKTVGKTLGSAAVMAACVAPAWADNHGNADGPTFFPVEMWTCDYRERQDRADLDRAIGRWQAWAKENTPVGYSAWLMTPHYFNTEAGGFDVAWLGGWRDFTTMGSNHDQYLGGAKEIQTAFEKVLDCTTHIGAWAVPVMPPMNESPPDTGVVNFSSCQVSEGSTPEDAWAAHRKWAEWLRGKGSKMAQWAFFPGLGVGKTEMDYYAVTAYDNNTDMGATMQIVADNEGWVTGAEIFSGVAECDGPRSYGTELLFNGQPSN